VEEDCVSRSISLSNWEDTLDCRPIKLALLGVSDGSDIRRTKPTAGVITGGHRAQHTGESLTPSEGGTEGGAILSANQSMS
jgi:hypothetical protein